MKHISLEGRKYSFTKCEDTIHVYSMTGLRWNVRTCQASFTGWECLECVLLLSLPIKDRNLLPYTAFSSVAKNPHSRQELHFWARLKVVTPYFLWLLLYCSIGPDCLPMVLLVISHMLLSKASYSALTRKFLDLSDLLKGTMVTVHTITFCFI